jgi:hypothetical protein
VFGLLSRSGLSRDMPNRRAPQNLSPIVNDLHGGPAISSKYPMQRESVRAACARFT